MNKLSELTRNFVDKIKGLSKRSKIIIGICISAAIVLIIYGVVTMKANKYDVLFSNLDSNDSKVVLDKLEEKKIDYNVEGNTIYVPKDQADQLRLDLASELTGGSKGFELFDEENKWGMTDKEMDIKYQRALEGELERTITSLPQIEDAKVHLVMSDKSVFVKEGNPASASVTLNIKNDQDISPEQVKAIVALLTGAVDNLPNNKVKIVDNKMRLLTENLFDGEEGEDSLSPNAAITATEKQQELKKKYEKHLSDNLQDMLEKIYGVGKVKVSVNADLNFDANQEKSVTLDPKGVVISEKTVRDTSTPGGQTNNEAAGVTDNQLEANKYPDVDDEGENATTHEEDIRNYEVSKAERKTITAPGKINRLTTSVVVDGNLDQETKNSLRNLVINAIGYDEERGDSVSVEGMMFNTDLEDTAKKDLEEMNQKAEKLKKYKMFTGIGIAALILIIVLVLYIKKKRSEEEMDMFGDDIEGLDVVLGDEVDHKQPEEEFKPVDFEPEEKEKIHIENEIKKYAAEKPDQVADIIKAWLMKDEE